LTAASVFDIEVSDLDTTASDLDTGNTPGTTLLTETQLLKCLLTLFLFGLHLVSKERSAGDGGATRCISQPSVLKSLQCLLRVKLQQLTATHYHFLNIE